MLTQVQLPDPLEFAYKSHIQWQGPHWCFCQNQIPQGSTICFAQGVTRLRIMLENGSVEWLHQDVRKNCFSNCAMLCRTDSHEKSLRPQRDWKPHTSPAYAFASLVLYHISYEVFLSHLRTNGCLLQSLKHQTQWAFRNLTTRTEFSYESDGIHQLEFMGATGYEIRFARIGECRIQLFCLFRWWLIPTHLA